MVINHRVQCGSINDANVESMLFRVQVSSQQISLMFTALTTNLFQRAAASVPGGYALKKQQHRVNLAITAQTKLTH